MGDESARHLHVCKTARPVHHHLHGTLPAVHRWVQFRYYPQLRVHFRNCDQRNTKVTALFQRLIVAQSLVSYRMKETNRRHCVSLTFSLSVNWVSFVACRSSLCSGLIFVLSLFRNIPNTPQSDLLESRPIVSPIFNLRNIVSERKTWISVKLFRTDSVGTICRCEKKLNGCWFLVESSYKEINTLAKNFILNRKLFRRKNLEIRILTLLSIF